MTVKLCVLIPAHWSALMGGSEYQAKILIDYLLRHHDVEITYLTAHVDPAFEPTGYRVEQFSDRRGLRKYGSFFDAFRLYRALRKLKPDVIFQAVGCAHTGIAAFYAKRNGCRLIYRVTNDRQLVPETAVLWRAHYYVEKAFLNYGIRHADAIVAQTDLQRRLLARRFGRTDSVLVQNYHPLPADVARAPRSGHEVVWIANMKPVKNPAAFVRLAQSFAARRDVHFTMIGAPGNPADWMAEQLALIATAPNLTFLGKQSQEEVAAALQTADVLVNTSHFEGFSNTFIQAWFRRVPVATLRIDPDGLLSRGGLGAVARNEEELHDQVAALLDEAPAARALRGERCRAYAVANHSEANIAAIAALLAAPPRAAPLARLTAAQSA